MKLCRQCEKEITGKGNRTYCSTICVSKARMERKGKENLIKIRDKEIHRKSGVYILGFSTGLKVGIAKNMHERLKEYTKPWNKEILYCKIYYSEYNYAKSTEKLLKGYFKPIHERSTEFFNMEDIWEINKLLHDRMSLRGFL